MKNKTNYIQLLNIINLISTRQKKMKFQKMKQNPEKWNRDYFHCALVTEILFHCTKLWITPICELSKKLLRQINRYLVKKSLEAKLLVLLFCTSMVQLTYFSPVSLFYTPWKRRKIKGILTFSGGIEIWHWTKMG